MAGWSFALGAIIFLFFALFIYSKRTTLLRLLSIDAAAVAGEFESQMEQTAERILDRLEVQASRIEVLMAETDAKIAVLEQQLKAAEKLIAQTKTARPEAAKLPADWQVLETVPAPKKTVSDAPTPQPARAASTADREISSKDKRQVILLMADQGYNITEIAKATGVGKGEIMLLLQLNKR